MKITTKIKSNMKKSLLLAALVLIGTGCYAQKSPLLKKVKSSIMTETPDYNAARTTIEEAIASEPNTETYYWAGMIGYQEVTAENYNQLMGKGVNQLKAVDAVIESIDYWIKADEFAMVPTLDKKGREVVDQKTRNSISKKILEYYKNQELVKYGSYLDEIKDFERGYQAFSRYVAIPDLAMMQNEKMQKEMPRDTIYLQCKFFAALFAIQTDRHEEAAKMLSEMKDSEWQPIRINQFLYQEYVELKDTAKFLATLQEAIEKFPQEQWFLKNLINYYIYSGQEQQAVDYLSQVIAREPNEAQYYLIRGGLNANIGRYDDALADYDNALKLDPTLAEAEAGKGRVYYNQAVKLNEDAALISDNKAYKKALDEMNEVFRKALPYFEKAHELAPEDPDYMDALKRLYYRFGMDDKYMEISEKLKSL